MKPLWQKQHKKYKIRWARKPHDEDYLSGVVLFYEGDRTAVVNIRFDPSLVPAIGKHLPYGIGRENPAYIVVNREEDSYEIWCRYLSERACALLLWRQSEKPEWIKGLRNEGTQERKKPWKGEEEENKR